MKKQLPFKKQDYDKMIAFAGNPNVGKSTLFNSLTGMNQHTGNWTGKTVSTAAGCCKSDKNRYLLVDIPGTYSLCPRSAEEAVARDFIYGSSPDAVVAVCDATCLERSLLLVYQILEITSNVVVCVNLIDEAKRRGITIDLEKLSQILGVPTVGTVARKKSSTKQLLSALDSLDFSTAPTLPAKKTYTDSEITQLLDRAESTARAVTVTKSKDHLPPCLIADRILTGRLLGYPLMLALLLLVFWLTVVGANYPSELLSAFFVKLSALASDFLLKINTPPVIRDILIDGILRTLCWVVSVMLPPMAIFFPLFTLLEDLGYLPRIAYNLDKPFAKCNACGKQALTMCMGFGCNAVGVTGCRIIDSPAERLVAILTNSFVPCNGRFPTLLAIISMFLVTASGVTGSFLKSAALTLVILSGIAMTLLMSALLSKTLLRAKPSSFVLELPPYRRPELCKTLIRSVLDRTLFVLGRAVVVAAPAGLVIWLMANLHIGDVTLLSACSDFLDPLGSALGMDGVILMAFILGFPANEIVLPIILMSYLSNGSLCNIEDIGIIKGILTENGWTLTTALCTMTFSLFHFPCSTTVITVYKETHSLKWTFLSALLPTLVGALCCLLINLLI